MKNKFKEKGKGKFKLKGFKIKLEDYCDWGEVVERLEEGVVDMSYGDLLFCFM